MALTQNAIGNPTVYLAVHPNSWTEPKPSGAVNLAGSPVSPLSSVASPIAQTAGPSTSAKMPLLSTTTAVNVPQQFIIHQHSNAIRLLANQPLQPWLGPGDFRSAKRTTRLILACSGVGTPSSASLEDLYAKVQEAGGVSGGVAYDFRVVE